MTDFAINGALEDIKDDKGTSAFSVGDPARALTSIAHTSNTISLHTISVCRALTGYKKSRPTIDADRKCAQF